MSYYIKKKPSGLKYLLESIDKQTTISLWTSYVMMLVFCTFKFVHKSILGLAVDLSILSLFTNVSANYCETSIDENWKPSISIKLTVIWERN